MLTYWRNSKASERRTGLVILPKLMHGFHCPKAQVALPCRSAGTHSSSGQSTTWGSVLTLTPGPRPSVDIHEQVPVPWCRIFSVSGNMLGLLAQQTRLLFP